MFTQAAPLGQVEAPHIGAGGQPGICGSWPQGKPPGSGVGQVGQSMATQMLSWQAWPSGQEGPHMGLGGQPGTLGSWPQA